jgi:hypothetical protein
MNADGSIIAPVIIDESLRFGKPLPFWFGTAASFIQELMAAECAGDETRLGKSRMSNPSGVGERPRASGVSEGPEQSKANPLR